MYVSIRCLITFFCRNNTVGITNCANMLCQYMVYLRSNCLLNTHTLNDASNIQDWNAGQKKSTQWKSAEKTCNVVTLFCIINVQFRNLSNYTMRTGVYYPCTGINYLCIFQYWKIQLDLYNIHCIIYSVYSTPFIISKI